MTKAYEVGYEDGQQWDYDSATVQPEGWDEATINAIGSTKFGERLGLSAIDIEERGDAWSKACNDYNRGCVAGVTYMREA